MFYFQKQIGVFHYLIFAEVENLYNILEWVTFINLEVKVVMNSVKSNDAGKREFFKNRVH